MTYPYQLWAEDLRQSMPGVLSLGDGDEWMIGLWGGLERIDQDYGEIYRGIVDPADAAGPVLDIVGAHLGEPRGGLGDAEYRRILSARRVSRRAVSIERVWAGWVALTGLSSGTIDTGANSIVLTAEIGFLPSMTYRRRAGRIVRRLVGADAEVSAAVYRHPLTARFDTPGVGWDVGRIGYSLFTGTT